MAAKKAKKRGVKPGTKRGSYKRNKIIVGLEQALATPATLSLCQQLEETIQRFENRISNSIGRLNELMGKV